MYMTHTGRAFVKIHPNAREVFAAFASIDPRTENKPSRVFLEIFLRYVARLPSRRSHRSLAAHVDGRASAHGRSIRACGVFDRPRTRDPRWSARGAGRRERRRRRVRAATSIRRRRRRRFSRRRDKRLTRVTCAIFAASGSRALEPLPIAAERRRRERPRTRATRDRATPVRTGAPSRHHGASSEI